VLGKMLKASFLRCLQREWQPIGAAKESSYAKGLHERMQPIIFEQWARIPKEEGRNIQSLTASWT